MSEVNFVRHRETDTAYVASNIRDADAREVYETSGRSVLSTLERSVRLSQRVATITVDDEPAAIIGVGAATPFSKTGVPWMLGTDLVTAKARHILPYGPSMVIKMMQTHDELRNIVHVENKASIRWLKTLGFTINKEQPLGWRGGLFHPFYMLRG